MSKFVKVTTVSVAVLAALYAGFGYVGVPKLVKSNIESLGTEKLGQPVSLGDVAFNPWTWTLTLNNLVIGEKTAPTVALSKFFVDVSSESVTKLAPVIEALTVEGLRVDIDKDDPHWAKLMAGDSTEPQPAQAEPAKDGGMPPFALYNLKLANSSLKVKSSKEGWQQAITDINVNLPFIGTLSGLKETIVTPSLSMRVNGNDVKATGSTKPFGSTIEATLTTELHNLDLVPFTAFVPEKNMMGLKLASGTVSGELTVVFRNPDRGTPGRTLISGTTSLNNLSVTHDAKELVGFKRLAVDLKSVDVIGQTADVNSVRLDNPRVKLVHGKSGIVGVPMANPHGAEKTASDAKAATPTADTPAWGWRVGEIAVTDGLFDWTDTTVGKKPAHLVVSRFNANVKNLADKSETPATIDASLNTLGGTLAAQGRLDLGNNTLHLSSQAKGLNLGYVSGYVNHFAHVNLKAITGFNVNLMKTGENVAVSGSVNVDKFALSNDTTTFAKFNRFSLDVTRLDTEKRLAAIGNVVLDNAQANLALTPTGTNVTDAMGLGKKADDTKDAAPKTTTSTETPWTWDVSSVSITRSGVHFTDETKAGNPSVALNNVRVALTNLSSRPKTVSGLDMSAGLSDGTLQAKGQFSLEPVGSAVKVRINRVNLGGLSPMMLAYSGLGAKRGVLNLDGELITRPATKTAPAGINWQGDVSLANLDLINTAGVSLMNWKKADLLGMKVHTAEPVSFKIAEARIDSPGNEATQRVKDAGDAIGMIAGLFGNDKIAREANRVNRQLEKTLVIQNVSYENGNLTAGNTSSNAIAEVLLQKLGGELVKVLK